MASMLGEVHASSIASVKFCSRAIENREIRSRSCISNRMQLLASLAIDTQEEFLRSMGLSEVDLLQLTCSILRSDLVRSQRTTDTDALADLITCSVVNAILSKAARKVELSSSCL